MSAQTEAEKARCKRCGWKSQDPIEDQRAWLKSWELHEGYLCPAATRKRWSR